MRSDGELCGSLGLHVDDGLTEGVMKCLGRLITQTLTEEKSCIVVDNWEYIEKLQDIHVAWERRKNADPQQKLAQDKVSLNFVPIDIKRWSSLTHRDASFGGESDRRSQRGCVLMLSEVLECNDSMTLRLYSLISRHQQSEESWG
eukprot:3616351-Amphidinium_carterae.7